MKIHMIVAVDQRNGIAKQGKIPWYLPQDLKLFRQRTMGHIIIVGRKTWESFKSSLEGRKVIVLTTQQDYLSTKPFYAIAHSVAEALEIAKGEKEIFVIGGEEVYKIFLPITQRVYLTRVTADAQCDQFFPILDTEHTWEVIPNDVDFEYPTEFYIVIYERKR